MSDTRAPGPMAGGAARDGGQGSIGAAAGQVRQEAAGMVEDLRSEAGSVAEAAREQVSSFAEEQQRRGAEQAEGLAQAVRGAADQLQETSPQLAQYVQEAASAMEGLARGLRDSSPGQIMGQVEDLARRQPVAFFGAAVLAGFALARFARSSAEAAHHGGSHAGAARAGHHADAAIGGGRVVPHSTAAGAPGWVQRGPDDTPRPATVAAASLGGAAARTQSQAGQTSPVQDAG
ncbi:hypothetical protein [Roseicella aquatilis]|uniref:Nutrient deprivation-induced protein n=1 Tax=Roseicella aquatilis TaxID=2527868 RepID=A0A4R4D7E4_9PROT|nr:hypothetical protein [Roseicella aquatilis]TCZ54988.1 hypothetical protein EXY23_22560 [Roseicella aquatilis]